jgi:all-trans-retinol 13,14-reductase
LTPHGVTEIRVSLLQVRSTNQSAWAVPARGIWPAGAADHHVIVVGAGIAGLSAGATLARRGYKVLVLETHNRPGGYCSSWVRKVRGHDGLVRKFVFDAGVQDINGLAPGRPIRRLLAETGADERIEWRRVLHRYVGDGLCLDFPEDPTELTRLLCRTFPADAVGITAFLAEIAAVYGDLYDSLGRPPQVGEAINPGPVLGQHAARWIHTSYGEMLDSFISDPVPKRLFTTIAEYVTDQPERLRVFEMAPLFSYYLEGGFYPAGGSQKLADVLSRVIQEHGGCVRLRTQVRQILVGDGGVDGVVTAKGDVHRAAMVIANGDVSSAVADIADRTPLPKRYLERMRSMRRGPSAMLVSLALDCVPDLPARVFVSSGALHFGIGNPSAVDASLAPPGCAAVTLMHLLSEDEASEWFRMDKQAYNSAKEALADKLIEAAEAVIPDLGKRTIHRQVAAPPTFTRYTKASNGNIYGAARGQWSPAVKSPAPGLLLAGAGCQNGPGVEAAVISGVAAANIISSAGVG